MDGVSDFNTPTQKAREQLAAALVDMSILQLRITRLLDEEFNATGDVDAISVSLSRVNTDTWLMGSEAKVIAERLSAAHRFAADALTAWRNRAPETGGE